MSESRSLQGQRLSLDEDLTIYNAVAHKQRLLTALAAHPALELDLSGVAEIDTAGFQLLLLVKREAARQGKSAAIVAHSPAVRDTIDFFNMAAQFGDPMLMPREGS